MASTSHGDGSSGSKINRRLRDSPDPTVQNENGQQGHVDEPSSDLLESLINPDFEELASQFREFRRAYRHVQQTQAGRPFAACITQEFSIALTKALLHTTWGISLSDLPLHHLCPPVPNRYFMVHWLQQTLLPYIQSNECFRSTRRLTFSGLDIGTGATCIYPLLFMASLQKNPRSTLQGPWRIWASDVDNEAIDLAVANVRSNQMQSHIQPFLVPPSTRQSNHQSTNEVSFATGQAPSRRGPLRQALDTIAAHHAAPSLHSDWADFDFCLTNPPFYDNATDLTQTRQGDGRSRTSMTVHEGTYPEGEIGFACDILMDQCQSMLLPSTQQQSPPVGTPGWTVIMCGKKSSFVTLYNIVVQVLGFAHVCSTKFGPGNFTRWFLAWTWQGDPMPQSPLVAKDSWEFSVVVTDSKSENLALDKVAQRMFNFGQEFSLACKETVPSHSTPKSETRSRMFELWKDESPMEVVGAWVRDDQLLPDDLQRILAHTAVQTRRRLLPSQGHFHLTIELLHASSTEGVLVRVCAYSHTHCGKREVAHLKQQIPGEIMQTNRKWRRRLQRQEN